MNEIDRYAYQNSMRGWPWGEKLLLGLGVLLLALFKADLRLHCLLFFLTGGLLIFAAGVPFRAYCRLLAVPYSFVLFGAIVNWDNTGLTLSRPLAALGGLYILCLTTPLAEWLSLSRGLGVPLALAETALWMYRLIGVSLESLHRGQLARKARLGDRNFTTDVRSQALFASGLEARLRDRVGRWDRAMKLRGGAAGMLGQVHGPAGRPAQIALLLGIFGLLVVAF